jgi:hypothetical protein
MPLRGLQETPTIFNRLGVPAASAARTEVVVAAMAAAAVVAAVRKLRRETLLFIYEPFIAKTMIVNPKQFSNLAMNRNNKAPAALAAELAGHQWQPHPAPQEELALLELEVTWFLTGLCWNGFVTYKTQCLDELITSRIAPARQQLSIQQQYGKRSLSFFGKRSFNRFAFYKGCRTLRKAETSHLNALVLQPFYIGSGMDQNGISLRTAHSSGATHGRVEYFKQMRLPACAR